MAGSLSLRHSEPVTLGSLAAPVTRRRVRRFHPSRIATLGFLIMAALSFAVPLYVIVTTSFKTMDQIRLGAIFSLPSPWSLDAWDTAWAHACSGMQCSGVKAGFFNSLSILVPSLLLSISLSAVTGYALALWNVRWAGPYLFVLFICAFVPFQIIMYPLITITGGLGIYGSILGIAVVHAVLAMPILTLIFRNFFKGVPTELISAAMMDSGSFWRIFLEIVLPLSGNIMIVVLILQITSIWNDFLVGLTFGALGTQPMTVVLDNIALTTTG